MENKSKIVDSFRNQTIFITGGSGFIGKLLIEKLLRVCYNINSIYVLLRPKRNKTPEQRMEEIFANACFDKLKLECPNFREKVKLVSGDCDEVDLGICSQDQELLRREVTIMIHAAANVRFNLDLRSAAKNVRSVEFILKLAKEMTNLKVLLYVSTAYSNCPKKHIKEKFYEPGIKAEVLFRLLENFDDEFVNSITPSLLKGWPNTYTFCKCITEDLLRRESKSLPVVVVRPAIIVSTFEEPLPGWTDNFYSIIGVCLGGLMGAIKNLHAKKNVPLHLVPCDFVINLLLAVIWNSNKKSSNINDNNQISIYNFTGSKKNLISLGKIQDYFNDLKWKYPVNTMFWFPFLNFVESRTLYQIRIFLQHTLLAYIADAILICMGRKPIVVSKFRKINELLWLLTDFTTKERSFESTNVDKLWKEMNEVDRKMFIFDMDKFDWDEYGMRSFKYGRIYLLNEKLQDISKARIKIFIFAVVHYMFIAVFWYLIFGLLKNVIFSVM